MHLLVRLQQTRQCHDDAGNASHGTQRAGQYRSRHWGQQRQQRCRRHGQASELDVWRALFALRMWTRMKSFYETLEVSPHASPRVIRAAYRCLAQHHHPDKNRDAEDAGQRLACINQAYAVLSDPQSRHAYDLVQGIHGAWEERRGHAVSPQLGPLPQRPPSSRPFGFRPLD